MNYRAKEAMYLNGLVLNSRTLSYMLLVLALVSAGFWGIVQAFKKCPLCNGFGRQPGF